MDKMIENYSIDEHIHSYACWTAARAASVSRFSNKEIGHFIEEIDLRNKLEEISKQQITSSNYKEWFIQQLEYEWKGLMRLKKECLFTG